MSYLGIDAAERKDVIPFGSWPAFHEQLTPGNLGETHEHLTLDDLGIEGKKIFDAKVEFLVKGLLETGLEIHPQIIVAGRVSESLREDERLF